MSEKGSCAHTVVHWTQCVAANGLTTDRWACPLCGTEFVSRAQLDEARAELAKIHNAVEEQYAITHRISCERNHARAQLDDLRDRIEQHNAVVRALIISGDKHIGYLLIYIPPAIGEDNE